jgi:hypothetical protein
LFVAYFIFLYSSQSDLVSPFSLYVQVVRTPHLTVYSSPSPLLLLLTWVVEEEEEEKVEEGVKEGEGEEGK